MVPPSAEETLFVGLITFVRFGRATRLDASVIFRALLHGVFARSLWTARIDECRERRLIGKCSRCVGAQVPGENAQKSESSRPSVDQRRLRLSCGDLLQLSVPWPTRWIVKQSLVAQVHCTQKQFAAAVHHFGTPLQPRRAV